MADGQKQQLGVVAGAGAIAALLGFTAHEKVLGSTSWLISWPAIMIAGGVIACVFAYLTQRITNR